MNPNHAPVLRSPFSSRWVCPAIIGAVTLLFFWSYFLLDQTLYAGDTAFVFVPFRQFLREHLVAGRIPLWNPTLFGGTPALAESQYQVFYPINWLLVPLGAARGMGWTLALHVAWMGVGMFLFLRDSVRVHRLAALFGAVSFACGASVQMRLGIPVYTDGAAWIPWILWGYDQARKHGGAWFVVPALCLALQLCVGAAQYSYYTLALLGGYHGFCLGQERATGSAHGRRAWGVLGFTLGMSALLAMAQLLPEAELARLSDRGTNASYGFAIAGSLLPRHLFFVSLFPKFYGLYTSAPLDGFAASSESGYLGVATLALLAAASATGARAQLRFWTVGALLSIFLALGVHNPLYPLMFRFLPGTATFRGAGNWLLITSFCCAALAALGLQAILDGSERARKRAFLWSAVLLVMALLILLLPIGAQAFESPQSPYGPWGQIAVFGVVAVLLGLLWKAPRALHALGTQRIAGALVLVLVLDLFAVSRDMELNQTILASDLDSVPPPVARLKAVNSPVAPERFWSEGADIPLESWLVKKRLSPDEATLFRSHQGLVVRSLMPSCIAAQYGMPGLTGAWGALMPLRRHPQPIYADKPDAALKIRWLRLLNTRYHLSFGAPAQSDWTPVSTETPAIYRDDKALPRAFWVGRAVAVTPENALSVVNGARFDPRREVALESRFVPLPDAANASPELRAATFSRYEENRFQLSIDAPARGQLVVMDTFYPGWRARVDGREVPIAPANFVGRAVAVEAGRHSVEMWFEPESVRLGMFVSLLSLSLLSGVAVSSWSAKRVAIRREGESVESNSEVAPASS